MPNNQSLSDKAVVAVENIIFENCLQVFENQGATALLAVMVLQSVLGRFQKTAIDQLIMEQVRPPEKPETEQSGTPQDLINELNNFYGVKEEPDGNSE